MEQDYGLVSIEVFPDRFQRRDPRVLAVAVGENEESIRVKDIERSFNLGHTLVDIWKGQGREESKPSRVCLTKVGTVVVLALC